MYYHGPSKEDKDTDKNQSNISQGLLFARIGLVAICTGLIIYAHTATTNPISYTNLKLDNEVSDINLLDTNEDYTITQAIKFKDERNLKELMLKFHNILPVRSNFALINVEIWNLSTNTCIFNTSIGCSAIEDNKSIRVTLNDTKVNNIDEYEIKLTGTNGNRYYQGKNNIYAYFTQKVDEDVGEVKVNGEAKPNSLYFQIR